MIQLVRLVVNVSFIKDHFMCYDTKDSFRSIRLQCLFISC